MIRKYCFCKCSHYSINWQIHALKNVHEFDTTYRKKNTKPVLDTIKAACAALSSRKLPSTQRYIKTKNQNKNYDCMSLCQYVSQQSNWVRTTSSMERRTSPACDYRPCPRRRAVLCAAIYCRFHPHESNPSSLILPPNHFAQSTPHPAWSAGRPRPATTVRARAGGQFCARQ